MHFLEEAASSVVAAAALGLGGLLAEQGDTAAARDAYQCALRSENRQIAEEAARSLQALL